MINWKLSIPRIANSDPQVTSCLASNRFFNQPGMYSLFRSHSLLLLVASHVALLARSFETFEFVITHRNFWFCILRVQKKRKKDWPNFNGCHQEREQGTEWAGDDKTFLHWSMLQTWEFLSILLMKHLTIDWLVLLCSYSCLFPLPKKPAIFLRTKIRSHTFF